jgi:hypothetical protein
MGVEYLPYETGWEVCTVCNSEVIVEIRCAMNVYPDKLSVECLPCETAKIIIIIIINEI